MYIPADHLPALCSTGFVVLGWILYRMFDVTHKHAHPLQLSCNPKGCEPSSAECIPFISLLSVHWKLGCFSWSGISIIVLEYCQRSAIPNTPCTKNDDIPKVCNTKYTMFKNDDIPKVCNTKYTMFKNDDIPKVCNTMFKNDGNKSEPLKSLKSILDVLCLIVSSYEAARSGK